MQNREKIQNLITDLEVLIYQLNDLEEYEKQAVRLLLIDMLFTRSLIVTFIPNLFISSIAAAPNSTTNLAFCGNFIYC